MLKRGTPKTIHEAIVNGLAEYGFINNEKIASFVLEHVKDFMAQKSFKNQTEHELWCELFHKIFNEVTSLKRGA